MKSDPTQVNVTMRFLKTTANRKESSCHGRFRAALSRCVSADASRRTCKSAAKYRQPRLFSMARRGVRVDRSCIWMMLSAILSKRLNSFMTCSCAIDFFANVFFVAMSSGGLSPSRISYTSNCPRVVPTSRRESFFFY